MLVSFWSLENVCVSSEVVDILSRRRGMPRSLQQIFGVVSIREPK